MTHKASSFVLSIRFVIALNAAVLLFCALSLLGILPTSASQSPLARVVPTVAPALTAIFLLWGRTNVVLAALAVLANVLVLAIGVAFLVMLLVHPFPITGSRALLTFVLLCVLVPLISGLAVASRWPSRHTAR